MSQPEKLGRAIVQIDMIGNRAQGFDVLITSKPTLDRPTVIALFEYCLSQLREAEQKTVTDDRC